MMDAGRGRGAPPAGRGTGAAVPPGGSVRATQANMQRKPLDTAERVQTYGLDLENLKFDLGDGKLGRSSQARGGAESSSVSEMWVKKGKGGAQPHHDLDASMFGDFNIKVASSAKPGTELGFEFKAILDNDYAGFNADDFDVEINASSIALSGVSTCEQCKQSIMNTADGVAVFGKAYHRNHIKCSVTGRDFTDGSEAYEGEDGQVYCKTEWEKRFLKTCTSCKLAIREKKPLIVAGKPFHKACFTCNVCKQQLVGRWFDDDGQILCENDFHRKRGTVCPKCTKPVEGESKRVGKMVFHPACYVCSYCRRQPEGFFKQPPNKPGAIYCTTCASRIIPDER